MKQSQEAALVLVVSAPSGAGKDTLLRMLLERYPELQKPATTTTRPIRESDGEVHGQHYYFTTEEEFLEGVRGGEFLEHARYANHLYGLSRASLEAVRQAGRIPVVILDVQGAAAVRRSMATLSVFIEAPVEELAERIRNCRPPEQAAERISAIPLEMAQAPFYDLRVRNGNGQLERAFADLCSWYEEVARPRLLAGCQQEEPPPSRGMRR